MIHKIDQNDRRILTLTAVRPCESVAPATLLSSLINLAHSICDDHSRLFATQRRNARESIRLVGLLRFFLEELRDHLRHQDNHLPHAVLLCFSELHFTFQKLLFLLDDCARSGARIWILMNSSQIAGQFQMLIRSVATALDVLPLDSLGCVINGEVRELVELVSKQARKSRFAVDVNDQCAMERVILILNQFENKYEPEKALIKRVLDFLEIRSWTDCNREVRFLEEEMSTRCANGDEDRGKERDAPLLSSLISLMCYCRAVIFDEPFVGEFDRVDARSVVETLSCLNPEDFRCPISLELMTDPVTVSTGQTYDRASIQKWLKSGNLTCPKTGEKLSSKELVPNFALKKLIQQFCADNGVSMAKSGKENRDISRTVLPGSPPAGEIVKFLAEFLAGRLTYGTDEQKNKAAFEVRLLAKSNVYNRSVLIDLEVVPPLLDLLTSMDPMSQENAIAALLKLSKHSTGQKSIIESGGLGLIVTTIRMGLKPESRQIAAAIIFYLTSTEKHRRFIGRSRAAIPALVELIRDGTVCGKRNAMAALFGVMLYRGSREKVLTSGIVPLLLDLIGASERKELVTDALAILATLAEDIEGSVAILQTQGLGVVMGLMIRSCNIPRTAKEYCVSILMDVCNNGGRDVVGVLSKEVALMPPLYSVAVDGTPQASRKARSLINLLQRFRETSYSRLAMASSGVDKGEGIAQEG